MSRDNWSGLIAVEGRNPSDRVMSSWNRVSPRYFDTVGTPLLRRRAFDERDRPGSPLVAVVTDRVGNPRTHERVSVSGRRREAGR